MYCPNCRLPQFPLPPGGVFKPVLPCPCSAKILQVSDPKPLLEIIHSDMLDYVTIVLKQKKVNFKVLRQAKLTRDKGREG